MTQPKPETDAPETVEINGVWYDRRDTVDALNGLLAEARKKIEVYKRVIREGNARELANNPTPPPATGKPENENERLLSCPFCGVGRSTVDAYYDDTCKRWRVGCGRCGASSGTSVHAEGSKEAVITHWNTRGFSAQGQPTGRPSVEHLQELLRQRDVDISNLISELRALEEATGESLEDEDAALVAHIEKDLRVREEIRDALTIPAVSPHDSAPPQQPSWLRNFAIALVYGDDPFHGVLWEAMLKEAERIVDYDASLREDQEIPKPDDLIASPGNSQKAPAPHDSAAIKPLTGAVQVAVDALEQAQDCIRGETPEDMTHEEGREDTISKIREALQTLENAIVESSKLRVLSQEENAGWRSAKDDAPGNGRRVELSRDRQQVLDTVYWHPIDWNLGGLYWRPVKA